MLVKFLNSSGSGVLGTLDGWSGPSKVLKFQSSRSLKSSGSFDISRTPKFRYFGPSSCPFWSTTPLEVKRTSPELSSDLILSKWSRTCRKFLRWKCSFKPQSHWAMSEDLLSIKHYYWNTHFIIMDNFQLTKTGNCWISSKNKFWMSRKSFTNQVGIWMVSNITLWAVTALTVQKKENLSSAATANMT